MNIAFTWIFTGTAMIAGLLGANLLTQATLGVGLICLGALAGILARIAQAGHQHSRLMEELKKQHPETAATHSGSTDESGQRS